MNICQEKCWTEEEENHWNSALTFDWREIDDKEFRKLWRSSE